MNNRCKNTTTSTILVENSYLCALFQVINEFEYGWKAHIVYNYRNGSLLS